MSEEEGFMLFWAGLSILVKQLWQRQGPRLKTVDMSPKVADAAMADEGWNICGESCRWSMKVMDKILNIGNFLTQQALVRAYWPFFYKGQGWSLRDPRTARFELVRVLFHCFCYDAILKSRRTRTAKMSQSQDAPYQQKWKNAESTRTKRCVEPWLGPLSYWRPCRTPFSSN